MNLPDVIAVFISRDMSLIDALVIVNLIIIRYSNMVVVEKPIHAVIYHVLVHPSVSNSTILAGMPVKVANLPIGGVNTLIRIMKIVAMEGLRLIEHIHGDEYVHRKKEQQQQEDKP